MGSACGGGRLKLGSRVDRWKSRCCQFLGAGAGQCTYVVRDGGTGNPSSAPSLRAMEAGRWSSARAASSRRCSIVLLGIAFRSMLGGEVTVLDSLGLARAQRHRSTQPVPACERVILHDGPAGALARVDARFVSRAKSSVCLSALPATGCEEPCCEHRRSAGSAMVMSARCQ
jgi:hypothetical protein